MASQEPPQGTRSCDPCEAGTIALERLTALESPSLDAVDDVLSLLNWPPTSHPPPTPFARTAQPPRLSGPTSRNDVVQSLPPVVAQAQPPAVSLESALASMERLDEARCIILQDHAKEVRCTRRALQQFRRRQREACGLFFSPRAELPWFAGLYGARGSVLKEAPNENQVALRIAKQHVASVWKEVVVPWWISEVMEGFYQKLVSRLDDLQSHVDRAVKRVVWGQDSLNGGTSMRGQRGTGERRTRSGALCGILKRLLRTPAVKSWGNDPTGDTVWTAPVRAAFDAGGSSLPCPLNELLLNLMDTDNPSLDDSHRRSLCSPRDVVLWWQKVIPEAEKALVKSLGDKLCFFPFLWDVYTALVKEQRREELPVDAVETLSQLFFVRKTEDERLQMDGKGSCMSEQHLLQERCGLVLLFYLSVSCRSFSSTPSRRVEVGKDLSQEHVFYFRLLLVRVLRFFFSRGVLNLRLPHDQNTFHEPSRFTSTHGPLTINEVTHADVKKGAPAPFLYAALSTALLCLSSIFRGDNAEALGEVPPALSIDGTAVHHEDPSSCLVVSDNLRECLATFHRVSEYLRLTAERAGLLAASATEANGMTSPSDLLRLVLREIGSSEGSPCSSPGELRVKSQSNDDAVHFWSQCLYELKEQHRSLQFYWENKVRQLESRVLRSASQRLTSDMNRWQSTRSKSDSNCSAWGASLPSGFPDSAARDNNDPTWIDSLRKWVCQEKNDPPVEEKESSETLATICTELQPSAAAANVHLEPRENCAVIAKRHAPLLHLLHLYKVMIQ